MKRRGRKLVPGAIAMAAAMMLCTSAVQAKDVTDLSVVYFDENRQAMSDFTENNDVISENEMDGYTSESEATYYKYQGLFQRQNIINYDGADLYGNPVSSIGTAGKTKVIIWGRPGTCPQTIDAMQRFDRAFSNRADVDIIAFDCDGSSANFIKTGLEKNNVSLSKVKVALPGDDASYEVKKNIWTLIHEACAGQEADSVTFPVVLVVDGSNNITYISVSYYKEGIEPVVSYVKSINPPVDQAQVTAFVNRLYDGALGRGADEQGLSTWVNLLTSGESTGADVASGFFFSDEMNNRNLSNEDFVELLYQVMMNRASDAGGKENWVNLLNCGVSRYAVYGGFAQSEEFNGICSSYGIKRGTTTVSEGRDRNYGATQFVSRLYTKALGRSYDVAGLNDWCNQIVDKAWSVTDVSTTGFFHSEEFMNKNLDNEEYVKVLYRTFLDREYDDNGLADWVGKLNSGKMSRDEVLKGFSYSEEFGKIMQKYGL